MLLEGQEFWMVYIEGIPSEDQFGTLDDAHRYAQQKLNLPENMDKCATILKAIEVGWCELRPVEWTPVFIPSAS